MVSDAWNLTVLVGLGIYLLCGILWSNYNKRRPSLRQIWAPDIVVILLWPGGFYYSYLRYFWDYQRYRVYGENDRDARFFSSWSEALACAENGAKIAGKSVMIFDNARWDRNPYTPSGELWQRKYTVEPSGDVVLVSTSRSRVIKKGNSRPQDKRSDETTVSAREEHIQTPKREFDPFEQFKR